MQKQHPFKMQRVFFQGVAQVVDVLVLQGDTLGYRAAVS